MTSAPPSRVAKDWGINMTEVVRRKNNVAKVKLKNTKNLYTRNPFCKLTDTGNGFIAHFPSHSACYQDSYVCLEYAQAHWLVKCLGEFKTELGFDHD